MRRFVFPLVLLFGLFSSTVFASPTQLKEGNRLFRNGHYDDALKLYNDALVDAPESSTLHFNAGDAAYQTGDFVKADSEFSQAAEKSPLAVLRAAAHYNRGNALFRQNKWSEAIEAYKESLRVNPKDENAKYNLGLAMNYLKNPPPSQSQPKSGQGKDKKDDKKGGSPKDPGQTSSGSQQPKPGEMSKEDAERLLEAARSGELKKKNQPAGNPNVPHPDEDW